MGNINKRLDDLENRPGSGGTEIKVNINWLGDGLVEDGNERISPDEWRKRHPGDKLILVGWDDIDNDDDK